MNSANDITEKLNKIEQTAELLIKEDTVQNIANLKCNINSFFESLPELIQKNEADQVINVIDLFHLYCTKYKLDMLLKTSLYYKIHILYFKAFTLQISWSQSHQNVWALDQLSHCLYEIEKVFEEEVKPDSPEFFYQQSPLEPEVNQLISKNGIKKLNYTMLYIECLLQHAALLSQKNENDKAKKKAEKCYTIIKTLIKAINKIKDLILMVGPENLSSSCGVQLNDKNVLKYLSFLDDFLLPEFNNENDVRWKSDLTQWKINKDVNDKILIKKIEGSISDRLLKRKIEKEWCEVFHISNVVKISQPCDFKEKLQFCELNDDFVLKLILMFSCCIFSIAAENRFVVKKKLINEEKEGEDGRRNTRFQQESYNHELKLQKSNRFIFSEKIHLKALELLLFGFGPEIRLIKHLLNSYKKNYSFNILIIEEEDEPSFNSFRDSEYFNPDSNLIPVNDPSDQEIITKINEKLKVYMKKKENPKLIVMKKKDSVQIKSPLTTGKSPNSFKINISAKDFSSQYYKNMDKFLKKSSFLKKNRAKSKQQSLSKDQGQRDGNNMFSSYWKNKKSRTNHSLNSQSKKEDDNKKQERLRLKTQPNALTGEKSDLSNFKSDIDNKTNKTKSISDNLVKSERIREPINGKRKGDTEFSSKFAELLSQMNQKLKSFDNLSSAEEPDQNYKVNKTNFKI